MTVNLVLDGAGTPLGARIQRAAQGAVGGGVRVIEGEAGAPPCLTLRAHGRSNIRYMAVPEGPEAPPFRQAVERLERRDGFEAEAWARRLAGLARPADITVFIAAGCPHCPRAVEAALGPALATGDVSLLVVDAQEFGDLASLNGIRSVPATLIDGRLLLTGVVSTDDLVEQILARDRQEYEARVLRSLIETGRIGDAAETLRSEAGPPAFVMEWERSATSTRMGLMLAAEEALGEEPGCLDGIVDSLVKLLQSEDASLRGDTADLLGLVGHPGAAAALREALSDPNPDVAEIAAEALDRLAGSPSGRQ